MPYDPSLMAPVDVGGIISRGIKEGQKTREQQLAKGAMAALVQNPNNPRALAALAQVDPENALKFRQQQLEYTKQNLAQHQDSILKGAEIIRQFNPKDQASYSAALQAAQGAGIDVSQVPQQYNPQYVDGVVKLADAFKPQADSASNPRYLTPQPGGGAYRYDPTTGQTTTIIQPNDGSAPAGTPVHGGLPKVASPEDAARLPPGTQFQMPDGRIGTVPGGAGGNASGGFHP